MATINGTGGIDTLEGTGSDDVINGLAGNDVLRGLGGKDTLNGGAGADTFWIGAGELSAGDVYNGGAGWDRLYLNFSGPADLTAVTLSGIEDLYGYASVARMTAAQVDAFRAFDAYDVQVTTAGAIDLSNVTYFSSSTRLVLSDAGNSVDFGYIASGVKVQGGAGNDRVFAGSGSSRLNGGAGNDTLVGGVGSDTLEGGTGADSLVASRDEDMRDGYDRLDGGVGADTMMGGFGGDTYVVDNAGDRVIEYEGEGQDRIESSISLTLGANIEDLTLTGTAAINGTGNALRNDIIGNQGANLLQGYAGDDRLTGGLGKDTLRGGEGNDDLVLTAPDNLVAGEIYDGGNGKDELVVNGGSEINFSTVTLTSIEWLYSNAQVTKFTAAQLDAFTRIDAYTVAVTTGGAIDLRDLEYLYSGANFKLSAAGNTIDFTGRTFGQKVSGDAVSGADIIRGGNGSSNFDGGAGNDLIVGGAAADTLSGGVGADTLTGGLGADRFTWDALNEGGDRITDFSAAQGDKLVFADLLKGGFVYRGAQAFTGGSDNSEARFAGGALQVDANGDGTTDLTITLSGITTAGQLTTADFLWS